jgi:hypothetical protein
VLRRLSEAQGSFSDAAKKDPHDDVSRAISELLAAVRKVLERPNAARDIRAAAAVLTWIATAPEDQ